MTNDRWLKTYDGEYFSLEYLADIWISSWRSSEYRTAYSVKVFSVGVKSSQSITQGWYDRDQTSRVLNRIMVEILETDTKLIDVQKLVEELDLK